MISLAPPEGDQQETSVTGGGQRGRGGGGGGRGGRRGGRGAEHGGAAGEQLEHRTVPAPGRLLPELLLDDRVR